MIYEKTAALFKSIAKNFAFHNANKRTALASHIGF
ncbi:Fic family protein [Bacillus seohaeanensis]|uniref:Fic family protein n=1 Tax=Bacillus seohaeanensis TaxID=284580 RepID=A0ABW5RL91_9BACI